MAAASTALTASESESPKLSLWSKSDFAELVSQKLKSFEREQKLLHLVLFHEVSTFTPLCIGASLSGIPAPDCQMSRHQLGQVPRTVGSRECTSPCHLTPDQHSSQVLERVARLDRVLSRPGGAALLCGKSGVGRRSVLRLLAYMHHLEVRLAQQPEQDFLAHKPTNWHKSGAVQVFTPAMPQDYNLVAFRADLKAVMLRAGVERRPTCLFLEDHQLGDPAFLECINSLLSGGEVSTACFQPMQQGWTFHPMQQGCTASWRPACFCFVTWGHLQQLWNPVFLEWTACSAQDQGDWLVCCQRVLTGGCDLSGVRRQPAQWRGGQHLCGRAGRRWPAGSFVTEDLHCGSCRRLPRCYASTALSGHLGSYIELFVMTLYCCLLERHQQPPQCGLKDCACLAPW